MSSERRGVFTATSRTGIEFACMKTFKWTIAGFDLIQRAGANVISAQRTEFHVEVGNGLPVMNWVFSLSPFNADTSNLWLHCHGTTEGDRPMPLFVARVFFLATGSKVLFQSDLMDGGTGCFLGRSGDMPLIDGALVLGITLEFYRDLNAGDMKFPVVEWNKINEHTMKMHFMYMLKTGYLADVRLFSKDGKEFYAHKFILRSRCLVFEALFRDKMAECKAEVVTLENLTGRAVKFLLHYLYSSEIPNMTMKDYAAAGGDNAAVETNDKSQWPTVEEVLHLASKYRLDELTNYLDKTIGTFCDEKNAWEFLKLCKQYSLEKGKEGVLAFMKNSGLLEQLALAQV